MAKVSVLCLLAVTFIAIPGGLAKMFFLSLALSPRVLPIWLEAGLPGFIFGFAIPMLLFQILGMLIGFCTGVFIASRFVGKQQMYSWLLEGKPPPGYFRFVKRIVEVAYR